MKISTKILTCFIFIICLVIARTVIGYIIEGIILDDTKQIKDVEAPLEALALSSESYDAQTSKVVYSALLHAHAGDYDSVKQDKADYDNIMAIIKFRIEKKTAFVLLGQSRRPQTIKDKTEAYLMDMTSTNAKAAFIEVQAWQALGKQDANTAYSLIMGTEYQSYKKEIYQSIQGWLAIEWEMIGSMRDNIIKDSQQIIYINVGMPIIIIIALIITMFLMRFFVIEQYDLYENLFKSSNDAMMTVKPPSLKFTFANPACLKLFNIKDEKQFLSLTPEDLSPEYQPDGQLSNVKARKMIERAMAEGSNYFKWVHKQYNGKDFNATVLLSRVEENGKKYLEATVRKEN